MESILESHKGRNVDKAPALLKRYDKGEGVIPSEVDVRLLGVRNFENDPGIANNYWDTSTLSATKGETVKVILPYETGSRELTESARFGLGLINPDEDLVQYGVNLDVEGRWEKYCEWGESDGVYTLQRNELVLNKGLKKNEAMKHKLLLTKLGHLDYVDGKFARSADEVAEIIGKTFELGESENGYDPIMGQYLPDAHVSDKGVLKVWCVDWLGNRANSYGGLGLGNGDGRLAFERFEDARTNA